MDEAYDMKGINERHMKIYGTEVLREKIQAVELICTP
jgi:hypothetical protein